MNIQERYKRFKLCFVSNRSWDDSIPVALWYALRHKAFGPDLLERIQTGSPIVDDLDDLGI